MAAPGTITVYDIVYDDAGLIVPSTTVTCVLDSTVETFAGGLIIARNQSTTTDPNGRFQFTLVPNDLMTPSGSTYTIQIPAIGRSYQIQPLSGNGSSQQSTAGNVIVNAPQSLTFTNLANPMTAQDDLILGGINGGPTRLPKGASGQILTVNAGTGHVDWEAAAAGFTNPMTNQGDLIDGGSGGTPQRLGLGGAGKFLRSDGTNPSWQNIAEGDVVNLTTDLAAKATPLSLTFKNAVRVATQSNQASLSGTPTIDGYATIAGDRILLKAQTSASQNGIWVVAAGAWTRPADFATGGDAAGNAVYIEGGVTNGGQIWAVASTVAVIIDTNNQTWTQAAGAGGGGLVIDGTAGDYNAIGASLVLGSIGKTIDSGTSLAHGSGYLANAHHNQAHADSDHTGANKVQSWLNGSTKYLRPIVNVIQSGLAVVTMADDAGNNKQDWTFDVTPVKSVLTSDVVISNTGVETQLIGFSVPANSLAVGTTYKLVCIGNVDLVATVAVTIRIKIGGFTLASYGPNGTSSTTVKPFVVIGWITCRAIGASGSAVGGYTIRQEWSGAAAGGAQAVTSTAPQTVDTTGALVVEYTAQWGTGAAGNIIRAFTGIITLEKA